MRKIILTLLVLAISLSGTNGFSQASNQAAPDTALLGLPGDNLDLFAVLNIFQKSKTIEEFEKTLNLQETGVNNLDLDLDNKVDFIKVVTKQDGTDFTFILQVAVNEKETQDVAVILVSKDKDGKVTMQIVGDESLYGKNYVVEPQTAPTPSVTANPAYTGSDPVTVNVPASTTVVVVESTPVVQYVYSPAYVPYYPPYYYGYYPPYFAAFTVMAIGAYHHSCYHHHYGYHGGYGGTVVIHNDINFNNYNNSRRTSNTVNNNMQRGNYNTSGRGTASTRPSTGSGVSSRPSTGNVASTRPSTGTGASTRPSTGTGASTRPSTGTGASTRPSTGASASTRPSTGTSASTRPSTGTSASTRQSSSVTRPTSSASRSNYSSASRSMSSSRSMGGGGGGRRR